MFDEKDIAKRMKEINEKIRAQNDSFVGRTLDKFEKGDTRDSALTIIGEEDIEASFRVAPDEEFK